MAAVYTSHRGVVPFTATRPYYGVGALMTSGLTFLLWADLPTIGT